MQEALIIRHHDEGKSLAALNTLLKQGAHVVHSCPMPSSGSAVQWIAPACLVIMERASP